MSVALVIVSAGASVGVGALAAPVFGAALSKPMTGEVVPTRLVDLAGYLSASPDAKARGLAFEGEGEEEADVPPPASPLVPGPKPGVDAPKGTVITPSKATVEQKRILAVASFVGGLSVAFGTFLILRRVFR